MIVTVIGQDKVLIDVVVREDCNRTGQSTKRIVIEDCNRTDKVLIDVIVRGL